MANFNIAIDGPAGAGKSTIAKQIAKKLNIIYVDTGAMYRALALFCVRNGIAKDDRAAIIAGCADVSVSISFINGEQQIILNGENVNAYIRTMEIGEMASAISVIPEIRLKLVELQRALAAKESVCMDGRDIGTYVLPDAKYKFYMTASADVRAKRRYDELTAKGTECDLQKIKEEIIIRDERDMNREFAPLKQAADAELVDTSYMTIDEVVKYITDKIGE